MAAMADGVEGIYQTALVNYLVSMARTVEGSVNRALEALLHRNERLASEVFLTEPRINEMEIVIDEHAIRLLRRGNLPESDVRLIVASLKVNNDLERMGDLAVNICQRVISLAAMSDVANPPELPPMTAAVRAMVNKSLGALIFQNVTLANEVLESDDIVDQYRDQIFESLLAGMTQDASRVAPNMHFVLATRHLERIADHTTNIAEDILFWVRGLDVRHGRAFQAELEAAASGKAPGSVSPDIAGAQDATATH
jgi:phosphate transport system protein